MPQKKIEQSILTPILRAMILAFSYLSSSLERFLFCSADGMAKSSVSANLGYAYRELEKAHRACLHAGEQIGKNNTANTIDFRNDILTRAVGKAGISIDLWVHEWTLVEEFGLAATMENVARDILDVADKVKRIGVRIENDRETKIVMTSMYYDLMIDANAVMRALSVVGLIADMANAIKSGRREVHSIMIPLKGENLMSKIHSRQVVDASV